MKTVKIFIAGAIIGATGVAYGGPFKNLLTAEQKQQIRSQMQEGEEVNIKDMLTDEQLVKLEKKKEQRKKHIEKRAEKLGVTPEELTEKTRERRKERREHRMAHREKIRSAAEEQGFDLTDPEQRKDFAQANKDLFKRRHQQMRKRRHRQNQDRPNDGAE